MQRSLLLKILLSLEVIRIYTIEDGVTIKYGVCKFLLVLHCNWIQFLKYSSLTNGDPLTYHCKYTVSQKTGPVLLIWHNFTNSQYLLITFGRGRDLIQFSSNYGKVFKLAENQLHGFYSNSSDLTHLKQLTANSEINEWQKKQSRLDTYLRIAMVTT